MIWENSISMEASRMAYLRRGNSRTCGLALLVEDNHIQGRYIGRRLVL